MWSEIYSPGKSYYSNYKKTTGNPKCFVTINCFVTFSAERKYVSIRVSSSEEPFLGYQNNHVTKDTSRNFYTCIRNINENHGDDVTTLFAIKGSSLILSTLSRSVELYHLICTISPFNNTKILPCFKTEINPTII